MVAMQAVRQVTNPVTYEKPGTVTQIWVDAALRLNERDLKIMDRLVRSAGQGKQGHQLANVV